ncbi:MAG: hypothetical protein RSA12_10245, partial [Clostridia bacterium]
EALKAISANDRASAKAMKGKRYCNALVSLADKRQSRTPAERSEPRQTQSVPLMAAFHRWPEDVRRAVLQAQA